MKKITKILSALLMVTLIAVAFTACSGGSGVAGKTYVYESFSTGDDAADELTASLLGSLFEDWTMSFGKDGTCTMKMSGEEASYEYEISGSKVTLKNDDKTMEFEITGGKLVIEQDGVKITFKAK